MAQRLREYTEAGADTAMLLVLTLVFWRLGGGRAAHGHHRGLRGGGGACKGRRRASRALLRERYGITDMSMVAADPWFYGDRFGERNICPYLLLHPPCSNLTDIWRSKRSCLLIMRFMGCTQEEHSVCS